MSRETERLQILKMVEKGQVTPDEGARLLQALSSEPEEVTVAPTSHTFRVRVTDLTTGRTRIDIAIPTGLVALGVRLGARFAPEGLGVDMADLVRRVEDGVTGVLADVRDEDRGERIELTVE